MSAQKVVLITAGTAGLGAQIARVFAPDFRVVVNYANNKARADSLLQELSSIARPSSSAPSSGDPSPRFHAIQADVGDKAAVHALVADAVATMGRLDVVVSNHGWTRLTNFADFAQAVAADDDWDRCFAYNVKSHLWLMHAAKPHLEATARAAGDGGSGGGSGGGGGGEEKEGGAFISTASVAGVKPGGSSLAYSVTKAAQIHLLKGLGVICAPAGIRCNSVSPGLMLTEWGMQFSEEQRRRATENTKLKRLPAVEDVADQVRTIALSKSMTGQNVVIDSGTTL